MAAQHVSVDALKSSARKQLKQGHLTQAEELSRRALQAQEETAAPKLEQLGTIRDLSLTLFAEGRYADAEALLRNGMASVDPSAHATETYADALSALGLVYRTQSR